MPKNKPPRPEEVITSINQGIANVLKNISEEFGIQVKSVQVEWINISSVGEPKYHLDRITIEAQSKPR